MRQPCLILKQETTGRRSWIAGVVLGAVPYGSVRVLFLFNGL